jgi:hypothetical protein
MQQRYVLQRRLSVSRSAIRLTVGRVVVLKHSSARFLITGGTRRSLIITAGACGLVVACSAQPAVLLNSDAGSGTEGGAGSSSGDATTDGATEAGAGCAIGADETACPSTGTCCNGTCRDTTSDDDNCGACGYACVHGRTCSTSRCTPAWLPISGTGAPEARTTPGAALGGQLVISGGTVNCAGSLATAAEYDPDANAWTSLPSLNTARSQQTVVSSGTAIYTFGGLSDCSNGTGQLGSLETWTTGASAWSVVNGTNPPAARYAHESAWTGSAVFIYGGSSGSSPYVTSGAVYAPLANSWSDASCSLANCQRNSGLAIIDQGFVRTWGGGGGTAPAGIEYSIGTGAWSTWTPPAAFPLNACTASACGYPADDGRRVYVAVGGCSSDLDFVIYDRQTQSTRTDAVASLANLSPVGSIAWIGSEVVLWSGPCGSSESSVGGRYQPPAP